MDVIFWASLALNLIFIAASAFALWKARPYLQAWQSSRDVMKMMGPLMDDGTDDSAPPAPIDDHPEEEYTPTQMRAFENRITKIVRDFHASRIDEAGLRLAWVETIESLQQRPLSDEEHEEVDRGIKAVIGQKRTAKRIAQAGIVRGRRAR